ncbi:GntR family transcriptional regulator [Rhodococcus erythropolis]|uniref:GntR family transcriptional regulator n=1 Tax=Rhodococcus erythropolis TaxID=1833 RepID=UPI00366B3309
MFQYEDLVHQFRTRILSGEWQIGEKIPTIKTLQAEYGIRSLNTVRQAQQVLVTEGLLETRHGLGAFVVSLDPVSDPVTELTSIRDHMNAVLSALSAGWTHTLVIDNNDPDIPFAITVIQEALQRYLGIEDEGDSPRPGEHADTARELLRRVNSVQSDLSKQFSAKRNPAI